MLGICRMIQAIAVAPPYYLFLVCQVLVARFVQNGPHPGVWARGAPPVLFVPPTLGLPARPTS